MSGTRPLQRAMLRLAPALVLIATACASAPASTSQEVLPGVDVLLRDGAASLAGKRVGLITNHTGIGRSGESTIDMLQRAPGVRLVALFGPEHSISGRVEAGERVDSGRDPRTGLPVFSLYGETRKPTPESLRDVDVLVFDIQDVGTRYYTYMWTMALALQAAAENDRQFIVLDRPNPIGGTLVQGNILDDAYRTFVGLYPVPMRHGMTPGEMARYLNTEHGIGARLTVIPVANWHRSQWFEATGLPWTAPSPNMPSVESATHYPGTCLFEGTNVSVGRGTPEAFAWIGAPWIDAAQLATRLQRYNLAGVRFEAVSFTPRAPGDGKFSDTLVHGVRFVTTDRSVYDPTRAALAALIEIHAMNAQQLTFHVAHFDRLAGSDRVRQMVLAGETLERIAAPWDAQIAGFQAVRSRYLIYPE